MGLLVTGNAVCSGVRWGGREWIRGPRKSILEELRQSSALSSADPECSVALPVSPLPPFKTTGAPKISSGEGGRSRWRGPRKPETLPSLQSPPSHLKPQQRLMKLATQPQNPSFVLADSCGLVGPLRAWQQARAGWFLGRRGQLVLSPPGVSSRYPKGHPVPGECQGRQGGALSSSGFPERLERFWQTAQAWVPGPSRLKFRGGTQAAEVPHLSPVPPGHLIAPFTHTVAKGEEMGVSQGPGLGPPFNAIHIPTLKVTQ